MKKTDFRKPLIALCIMLGIGAIVATGNEPKPDTGEFIFFSVDPSINCLNSGTLPFIVRVNFRANSSSNQCVDIRVNDIPVPTTTVPRRKCATGEWTDSYTFNLISIFGSATNIPPKITITGQLLQSTAPTVIPKLFDTATATITTSTNCPPPPPPGVRVGN